MNDAHWIAQIHRYGFIKPSFIPEDEFHRMRVLSRHRTNLVEDRGRVRNRVQKVLEGGKCKQPRAVIENLVRLEEVSPSWGVDSPQVHRER